MIIKLTLSTLLLLFGLAGGVILGSDFTRQQERAKAAAVDARETKILAWIVERNPAASIKDFQGFPRVLLQESEKAGVDFRIVIALIDKESHFKADAVGRDGEIGLMQILPGTAAIIAKNLNWEYQAPVRKVGGGYISLGTLADPTQNVRFGLAYLRDQVDKFGMTPTALRAYNRAPSKAMEWRPLDRYAEDIGLRLVALVHEFPK